MRRRPEPTTKKEYEELQQMLVLRELQVREFEEQTRLQAEEFAMYERAASAERAEQVERNAVEVIGRERRNSDESAQQVEQ